MLATALLCSVPAESRNCDELFANVYDFLSVHGVQYTDLKSFVIIDPEGSSPLNLIARMEELQNRQMVIRMSTTMHFHPYHYAAYQWRPEVKDVLVEISRTGLRPSNLSDLYSLDMNRGN